MAKERAAVSGGTDAGKLAGKDELVVVYVRKSQEYDVLSAIQQARIGLKWKGDLPKVPQDLRRVSYRLLRAASKSCGPDGDALHAFRRSSFPAGLVVRKVLEADGETRAKPLARLILNPATAEEARLLSAIRKRGCGTSRESRQARPKPIWWRPKDDEFLIPVAIPGNNDMREALADIIGEANSAWGPDARDMEIAPYIVQTVATVAAAVAIQSAWRSFLARQRAVPPIVLQVIYRRAIVCIQRHWRAHLFRCRFHHLEIIRRQIAMLGRFDAPTMVMTVGSYRRMVRFADARSRGQGFPGVAMEHRLRFSFDDDENVIAVSTVPDVRRGCPRWAGADMPVRFDDEVDVSYGADELKYLLFKGVVMKELGPPLERAECFLATDYMMQLTYSSCREAVNRLALFAALTYDYLTRSQLVTLLPAPIILDRSNPASMPGMGLTDSLRQLGTLEDLVKDVLPRDSALWPYVKEYLAPRAMADLRKGNPAATASRPFVWMKPYARPVSMRFPKAAFPRKSGSQDVVGAGGFQTVSHPRSVSDVKGEIQGPPVGDITKEKSARTTAPPGIKIPTHPEGTSTPQGDRQGLEENGPKELEEAQPQLPLSFGSQPEMHSGSHPDFVVGKSLGMSSREAVSHALQKELDEQTKSLAQSMALTRKLMAKLQRLESAECSAAVKINLFAELARRQEQADMIRSCKGQSMRRFWRTNAPFTMSQGPTPQECTMMARDIGRIHAKEGRMLIDQMRQEHKQLMDLNSSARSKSLQALSRVALQQQTTILKEIDKRRFMGENQNRKKVQLRKAFVHRGRMREKERRFVQAFQRQQNVLNRQILTAELQYRSVIADEQKYDGVVHLSQAAAVRREEMMTHMEASRQQRRDQTMRFHAKCAAAIAKNKEERAKIKDIVAKRRDEIRSGMEMVGPAGGVWGARRPETYRQVLNPAAVTSAAEKDGETPSRSSDSQGPRTANDIPQIDGDRVNLPQQTCHNSEPASLLQTEKTEEEWAAELEESPYRKFPVEGGAPLCKSFVFNHHDTKIH
uniref:Uncharacterized protein n=2 Tax=Tetraselmis sp. GSL018 TaxID=582737 RepID=A0A061S2Q8_9CHLO|eukprot:CAMPEP_0177602490 /NCGR_PEP_ID=MMETSP0419_2-20121207/14896_1 /TAXON_ID=582737 /ORGANISM="Tetraselmis sp., Strain GSL018" /LENGTH=1030 /DNA_ID=CAMNT_0019095977 /DNA_START=131 /DNA_END=3223 /DNA_ORIENTATION=-